MKKQLLLSAFLILSISVITAQQSRFPIKPGSVWRINYEFNSSCSDDDFIRMNGDEEYKYFIDGDTLVGTRTYFKLYKTGIIYLDTPFGVIHKYMGAIRDSADRFFFVEEEEQVEKLLYDFTLEEGDSIGMEGTGMRFPISSITTLASGRKEYIVDIMTVHCGSANTIIEGIGWLGGLLEGNSCSGHPGVRGSYLVCYSEDGEVVYQSIHTRCGGQLPCDDIIVSSDEIPEPLKPNIALLSGAKLNISNPGNHDGNYDIRIFSTFGILTYQSKKELPVIIDLTGLASGIYLLRLEDEESTYSTKFVIP